MFSKNSISIGSQSTNALSRKSDLGFELPAPNYPLKTQGGNSGFRIPGIPVGFPGFPVDSQDSHCTPGIPIVLPGFSLDFQGFGIQKIRRFPLEYFSLVYIHLSILRVLF